MDNESSNTSIPQTDSDSASAQSAISIDKLQRLAVASNTLKALLAWDLATLVPHAEKRSLTVELKLFSGSQYQPALWLPSQKLEAILSAITTEILTELERSGIDTSEVLGEFKESASKLLTSTVTKEL